VPARPHPEALNLYLEAAPSGVRAIVMSTSRERLAENALTLSLGTRGWPFPDAIHRGRHGYHYRELSIPGAHGDVRDYSLVLSRPGRAPAASAGSGPVSLQWEEGRFDDGWVAERFRIRNGGTQQARVNLRLWNPTPRARELALEGGTPVLRESIPGGARIERSVTLPAGASMTGRVSPAYVPKAAGQGPDERRLGLRVDAEASAGS
jgi:hypothetical protein